jgi:glycosyltransferase involved in cell wall biosynthesis
MRILTVHNEYREPGGEDKVVEAETRLLRENGVTVEELRFHSSHHLGKLEQIRVAWELPHSSRAKALTAEAIEKFRPDILHVHNFFPLATPSVFEAAKERGIPTVLTLHNYRILCANGLFLRDGKPCELCVEVGTAPAVRYRCYQGSLPGSMALARMITVHQRRRTWHRLVDRFIVLTEFSKSRFTHAGLPEEKFTVKPNFLFDPSVIAAAQAGARPKVLFVGRLSPEKGLITLLAARALVKNKDAYELHIVGDGPLAKAVAAAASSDSNIHWHGSRSSSEVYSFVAGSDLMVFPSECYENFPIVILEAMAHGKPVLASRIGGLPEIIREGETGAFFEAGNARDLAGKIEASLANPAHLAVLGVQARKRYREQYTPQKNIASLLDI